MDEQQLDLIMGGIQFQESGKMKIYLETERMILREFTQNDLDLLVDLDSDPEVTRYINGGKPTPKDYIFERVMPRILNYYTNTSQLGIWATLDKKDLAFMGWFHFRRYQPDPTEIELGYRFKRQYWGRGLATEGSKALIQKGFEELDLDVIVAITDPEHGASRRVLEKAGLTYEKDFAEADGFIVVKYRLEREKYWEQKEALS